MKNLIIIFVFIFAIFFGILIYRLIFNPKWYYEFVSGEFKSKDIFTKIVKFLMT